MVGWWDRHFKAFCQVELFLRALSIDCHEMGGSVIKKILGTGVEDFLFSPFLAKVTGSMQVPAVLGELVQTQGRGRDSSG